MSVKSIKIESLGSRLILAIAALICVIAAFTFTKWCLASAVSTQADQKDVAAFAAASAPDDPQTHRILAILLEKEFLPEDLRKSLEEYEKAAALSPNNYLFWLSLGGARERAGDAEGAEKALQKALELAPNYAQVQWALGNTFLRQGKSEEAITMIRKAINSDPKLTNPAIVAIWQIYEGDVGRVRWEIGDSAEASAAFAVFLARQKQFEEAFEIWNSLPADLKSSVLIKNGEELANEFFAEKKYRAAQAISAQFSPDDAKSSAPEQIANGDFENDIKMQNASVYEWRIPDGNQPQIGIDNQNKRSGERSLLLIFVSTDGKGFRQISQIVTVEPEKNYRLSFAYKSELKTSVGLKWEIADAADGKVLGSSATVSGTADWTNASVVFTAPKTTEAVVVRLGREACPSGICPITGKVWFDDFKLTPNAQ